MVPCEGGTSFLHFFLGGVGMGSPALRPALLCERLGWQKGLASPRPIGRWHWPISHVDMKPVSMWPSCKLMLLWSLHCQHMAGDGGLQIWNLSQWIAPSFNFLKQTKTMNSIVTDCYNIFATELGMNDLNHWSPLILIHFWILILRSDWHAPTVPWRIWRFHGKKSDANRVWSLQTWIQWLRYPDLYPAVLWSAGKIWSVEHLPQKGDWNVMTSFGGTAWTSWSLDIDMIRSFGVPAGRAFFGFVGFFSLILCVFVSQVLASLGCLFILCLFNILPLFFVFGQLSQKSDSNYWWVFSGLEVWLALSLVAVVAFPQRLHQIFTTKGLLGKNRSVVRLVLVKLNIL